MDKGDQATPPKTRKKAVAHLAGRLLSLNHAASYMGWTLWEMRRFVWSGEVPHVRRGKRAIFIDRCDLDAWIETHKERYSPDLT